MAYREGYAITEPLRIREVSWRRTDVLSRGVKLRLVGIWVALIGAHVGVGVGLVVIAVARHRPGAGDVLLLLAGMLLLITPVWWPLLGFVPARLSNRWLYRIVRATIHRLPVLAADSAGDGVVCRALGVVRAVADGAVVHREVLHGRYSGRLMATLVGIETEEFTLALEDGRHVRVVPHRTRGFQRRTVLMTDLDGTWPMITQCQLPGYGKVTSREICRIADGDRLEVVGRVRRRVDGSARIQGDGACPVLLVKLDAPDR